jgi:transposase InsO family protein
VLRGLLEPCQYTSQAFTAAADVAGLQLSFGRTGDAFDNAAMETV